MGFEGKQDGTLAETPLDAARPKRALDPEIARLLARFQERMGGDQTQAHENSKPNENEIDSFASEAESYLRGQQRVEYYDVINLRGGVRGNRIPSYEASLQNIKITLEKLRGFRGNATDLLGNPAYKRDTRTLVRWITLRKQYPWTENDLSPEEKRTLDQWIQWIIAAFMQHERLRQQFIANVQEDFDPTVAEGAFENTFVKVYDSQLNRFLNEVAITGNPFDHVCQWCHIENHHIAQWAAKQFSVLEVGCGFSDFSAELRQHGVEVHTLDALSLEEIMEYARTKVPLLFRDPHSSFEKFCKTDFGEANKWHKKGRAEDIPRIFGNQKFDRIVACDSILQAGYFPRYERERMLFARTIHGVISGLKEDGGEFLAGLYPSSAYLPYRMERLWLPLLLALRHGGFEVPNIEDDKGKHSFSLFVDRYVRWSIKNQPPFRIRRNPNSNPKESHRVLRNFFQKNLALDNFAKAIE